MIRRAKQEDKEFIWQVHTEAIKKLCKSHYTQKQIQAWIHFLNPESYRDVIETREFFVVENDKIVIGFGQLNSETGEVEAVYIKPKNVGLGLGKSMMQTLEDVAREKGLKSLHLCSSLNAVPFYEKAGYTFQHESEHRLADGMKLACVYMEKHLNYQQSNRNRGNLHAPSVPIHPAKKFTQGSLASQIKIPLRFQPR